MRIESLQVENFQGIEHAHLVLGSLNVFYGDNGGGKSSLINAIDHLLTGEALRRVLLADMIRWGAASLHVEAAIGADGLATPFVLARKRSKSDGFATLNGTRLAAGVAETKVREAFGAGPALIAACLRSQRIFELKPAELQALLATLSGQKFDEATIAAELGADVVAAAKRSSLGLPANLDLFPDAEKRAIGSRQAGKRMRDDSQRDLARAPEPTGEAADHARAAAEKSGGDIAGAKALIRKGLDALRKRRDEALVHDAEGRVRASAEREARLGVLRARVAELVATGAAGAGDATARLGALQQALGEADRRVSAGERELADLVARIHEVERQLDGAPGADSDADMAARAAAVAKGLADIDGALQAIDAELADARKQHAAKAGSLKAIAGPHAAVSPCPVYPETTCPLTAAHFASLGASLAAAVAASEAAGKAKRAESESARARRVEQLALQQAVAAAQGRVAARLTLAQLQSGRAPVEARLAEDRDAAGVARGEAAALREAAADEARTAAREVELAEARREVARLEAAAAAPLPVATASVDLAETDGRLALGTQVIDALDMLAVRQDKEKALAKAQELVDDSHAVAEACGPTGARTRLIGRAAEPFLKAANDALQRFAPSYRIDLATDGELAIRVLKGDVPLLPCQLSDGELQIILYPLQYAAARLSGCGIIALDKVELIAAAARGRLVKAAKVWAAEGMQVFLLNNMDAPAAVPAGFTGYAVEAGHVRRLDTKAA